MIRPARLLYTTYGALLTWLAYCAIQSFRNGAPWHAVAFITSSGLAVIAAIREGELEDALRREAIRAERDGRLHPRPADDAVAAVAAAGLHDHNPDDPRSNAA